MRHVVNKCLKLCRPHSVKSRIDQRCRKTAATLLLVLLFSLIFFVNVKAESAVLTLQPRSSTIWGVDEELTINLTVTDVNGLYGWQIRLYYNSVVLNGTEIVEGPFLKSGGSTFFNFTFDDNFEATQGCLTAFETLVGNVSGINGAGVLATITFKAKAKGFSLLDLEDTKLGDVDSVPISHGVVDGAVEVVNAIHDVAIEGLTAVPTKVVDGQTVDIHVTAANRGNRTETFNVTVYYNETIIETRIVDDLPPGSTIVLPFAWNTVGVTPNATCIIKAVASQVPLETILENNVYEDGVIEVVKGIHDIAVTNVLCSSQSTYKGRIVNIYVEVKNAGNYSETFDLTVYRNDTAIETKTVNLEYSETKYVTFAWNTTDAEANATYLVKAVASLVPDEENSDNNICIDGYVQIYPPGLIEIEIVELTPSDESGQAVSSFIAGTTAYFKITVRSTSLEAEQILLTVNLYDSRGTTIGVISFNGPIGSETTTFTPGFPIPVTVSLGTANVYVNVLTDWPHLGGVPFCPEESATFEIRGS